MDLRKTRNSDRHLIAEQPGMAILLSGLIIAFFIGYTAKSLLSPARISSRIEKAASHIHKDVQVSFDSAKISFSNGILPRFAVIISGVQMHSTLSCWGAPLLTVDELRLPISLSRLFLGKSPLKNIEANNVHLLVREDFKDCEKQAESERGGVMAPIVRASPSEETQKYSNDIRGISIRTLHIASDKHPQYATELSSFSARVKSFEPRVIEIRAKSNLARDTRVGDYLSHANLYMEYKESPEQTLRTHFFGNWREGHYSVIANYTFDEEQIAVESDLKHIPLSQLLNVLQKYKIVSDNLNGRQVWISSKARMFTTLDNIQKAPIEVRDLRMEGDLGEVYVDRIDVTSVSPLVYQPIKVDIRRLDIEKLLFMLNRQKQTSVLGQLGVFSGRADIFSDEKMQLRGEHSGLEFVFSNKGQRELQILDKVVGDVSLDKNHWNFRVGRVEPRDGLFVGDLTVRADRDFQNVQVKTHVDEMLFAPAVQKLMTGNGEVGLMKLDSQMTFVDGQMSYLKGQLNLSGMQVEGMHFGKTKVQLDWLKNQFVLKMQLASLEVESRSPATGVLAPLTPKSFWQQDRLAMQNVSGRFLGKDLKNMGWDDFQASVNKVGRIRTEGSWNESSELKGYVDVFEGKKQRHWNIEGNREMPLFIEESPRNLRR